MKRSPKYTNFLELQIEKNVLTEYLDRLNQQKEEYREEKRSIQKHNKLEKKRRK